ncbi:PREDICTED: replication protein A 70 kDa DNA-binding subunit C isoform X1 [Camelina sativa]|uniref:Replication protein A 70 kDa DNA-binding subunit C isoform X1 n=1 Tax=Camelina sativa TaxID=90675 RepID=A0ABM0TFR5_CAMSA|nr:PREDICTED: replication protein A 70 kDa DNA-binding subunit C isoform X1 [Camelina sativa]XP_010425756.1 PREDICTED: replication protein A 70 kDa DNA-binding subunit C isoform X1 [Camelina sativa]
MEDPSSNSKDMELFSKRKTWSYLGLEAILVDAKGDRIQAPVKNTLVRKFKKEMVEGRFCEIMNFEVRDNLGDYKGTVHPYKINFMFTTWVKPSDEIPRISRFNCYPFSEISTLSNVDDAFFDIIGEIVAMSQITQKECFGQQSKLLDIQLRDLSGTIMDYTLWENQAEDVHSYVTKKAAGPIIPLGSLMRTKKFNGIVSVQNSRFSTKLFLDGDLSEIAEFIMQLGNRDSNDVITVSPLMKPDLSNKVENSFPLSRWESIDQITKTSQEKTCVTFARILEFRKEIDWYYVGCTHCLKTAMPYFNPETEECDLNKY